MKRGWKAMLTTLAVVQAANFSLGEARVGDKTWHNWVDQVPFANWKGDGCDKDVVVSTVSHATRWKVQAITYVVVDYAQLCWYEFLMSQKKNNRPMNCAVHSFHFGLAIMDRKLGAVQVAPTFWTEVLGGISGDIEGHELEKQCSEV